MNRGTWSSPKYSRAIFQGIKSGWARCIMPCGSAGTNNSLDAFNGSILEGDIVARSFMTMAQFLESVEVLLRQNHKYLLKYLPLNPLDVRQTVRASSQMNLRVKAWFAKDLELNGEIERSAMPVHEPDGHGVFYMISAISRRSGHHVLAQRVALWIFSQMPRILCYSPYVTWTVFCQ